MVFLMAAMMSEFLHQDVRGECAGAGREFAIKGECAGRLPSAWPNSGSLRKEESKHERWCKRLDEHIAPDECMSELDLDLRDEDK